jgi:hypothetical protein
VCFQFEEFIDVACLSDCFKFQMSPEIKLAFRSTVIQQRDKRWREQFLAEQKSMLMMDVEGKVNALEKQADSTPFNKPLRRHCNTIVKRHCNAISTHLTTR